MSHDDLDSDSTKGTYLVLIIIKQRGPGFGCYRSRWKVYNWVRPYLFNFEGPSVEKRVITRPMSDSDLVNEMSIVSVHFWSYSFHSLRPLVEFIIPLVITFQRGNTDTLNIFLLPLFLRCTSLLFLWWLKS